MHTCRARTDEPSLCSSEIGVPEKPSGGTSWTDATIMQRMAFGLLKRLWGLGITPQSVIRSVPRRSAERFVDRMTARRYGPYVDESVLEPIAKYLLEVSRAPPSTEQSFVTILEPGAWARRPLAPLLSQLKCKTSFAYGEHDWMDRGAADAACSTMANASVSVVKGADHNIHMTAPEGFADFIFRSAI